MPLGLTPPGPTDTLPANESGAFFRWLGVSRDHKGTFSTGVGDDCVDEDDDVPTLSRCASV